MLLCLVTVSYALKLWYKIGSKNYLEQWNIILYCFPISFNSRFLDLEQASHDVGKLYYNARETTPQLT